jgi:hypothetical protein
MFEANSFASSPEKGRQERAVDIIGGIERWYSSVFSWFLL